VCLLTFMSICYGGEYLYFDVGPVLDSSLLILNGASCTFSNES
jgi:hypothetical protein